MKNIDLTESEIKALIRLVQNEELKSVFVEELKQIEIKLINILKGAK